MALSKVQQWFKDNYPNKKENKNISLDPQFIRELAKQFNCSQQEIEAVALDMYLGINVEFKPEDENKHDLIEYLEHNWPKPTADKKYAIDDDMVKTMAQWFNCSVKEATKMVKDYGLVVVKDITKWNPNKKTKTR